MCSTISILIIVVVLFIFILGLGYGLEFIIKKISKKAVRRVIPILIGILITVFIALFTENLNEKFSEGTLFEKYTLLIIPSIYGIIITLIMNIYLGQLIIIEEIENTSNDYEDILSKLNKSSDDRDKRFFKESGRSILNEFISNLAFEEGSLQVNENRDVSILFYINFWKWLSEKQQSMNNSTKGAIVYRSINCIEFEIWDKDNRESESIYNYQKSFVQNGGYIYRILVGLDEEREVMDKIKNQMLSKINSENLKVHSISQSQLINAANNPKNLKLQDFTYDFLWLRNESICLKWRGYKSRIINGAELFWIDKNSMNLEIRDIWELAFDAAFQEYRDRDVIPKRYQYDFERTKLRVYELEK